MNEEKTRELIKCLRTKSIFFTSKDLATQLNVSSRTIQRLIGNINRSVNDDLIIAEKGRGYKLNYDKYLFYKTTKYDIMDIGNQRQDHILKKLLLTSPESINVDELFGKYYVSEAVIQSDEKKIEKKLCDFNLHLHRNHRFLKITGTEKSIRDALVSLVLHFDSKAYFGAKSTNVNNNDIKFAINQIELAESTLKATIPDPYKINFLAHIYILINRTKRFVKITDEDNDRQYLDDFAKENPDIYSVCVLIIKNAENYLNMPISNNEVYYLFEYLISSRLDNYSISYGQNKTAENVAFRYTQLINESLKMNISKEDMLSISKELKKHIIPLINRLFNEIRLTNELIEDIEHEYPKVLRAVEHASKIISNEFSLPYISKDESGFISLYFEKYIIMSKARTRILVICTTGIGTSELIAAKIKKELPNIEIVGTISNLNLRKQIKKSPDIDLLVSTIPISSTYGIPFILVSSMFSKQDKERVQKALSGGFINEQCFTNSFS